MDLKEKLCDDVWWNQLAQYRVSNRFSWVSEQGNDLWRDISWLIEQLLASEEGLWYMESVRWSMVIAYVKLSVFGFKRNVYVCVESRYLIV
jgi:hypothetical protein